MPITEGFHESITFPRYYFVASRGITSLLWLILLGTLFFMIFYPVSSWNGISFCLIFGIGLPLLALVASASNFNRFPSVNCEVFYQDGVLMFIETTENREKSFIDISKTSVRLKNCRWRMGYLENLVSCRVYRFWIPTFLLRKRYPIIEVTFTSRDLENVNPTLFPAGKRYVYPLGFTEETRNLWRNFLTEKEIPRLRDRWRWEMLIYWLLFYFGIVLLGWLAPHSHAIMEKIGINAIFTSLYLMF